MNLYEPVQIRLVDYGSREYRETLSLRNRVPMEPVGTQLEGRDIRVETKDFHICAFQGKSVVGALVLAREGEAAVIKHLVVDESVRNQEAGVQMLYFAEQVALRHGVCQMLLLAQIPFVATFQKYGYRIDFQREGGSPLVKMRKHLLEQDCNVKC